MMHLLCVKHEWGFIIYVIHELSALPKYLAVMVLSRSRNMPSLSSTVLVSLTKKNLPPPAYHPSPVVDRHRARIVNDPSHKLFCLLPAFNVNCRYSLRNKRLFTEPSYRTDPLEILLFNRQFTIGNFYFLI